jgi:YtfJ family uncharacterized protein
MKQILTTLLLALPLFALSTGQPLPKLTLSGDEGGRIDGTPFDSDTLRGKVYVIFYVDPDEKDLNEPFTDALKAAKFDRSRYGSVAVINLDATWMPNFALEAALKKKQEKFPDTIYVKDEEKKGVKVWEVADDDSDIIVIDRDGTVLYVHEGKIPEKEYDEVISLIREHL